MKFVSVQKSLLFNTPGSILCDLNLKESISIDEKEQENYMYTHPSR